MELKVRNNASSRIAALCLGRNQGDVAKVLEKLSSGYRINRSADDAAGLGVSEAMRALITGLKQACLNSKQGMSLVQTGEGALQELHSMLNRALYLADYAASGAYTDEQERMSMQVELDEICDDIERITKGTTFNGIHLFQDKGYPYETTKGEWKSLSQQTGRSITVLPQKSLEEALAELAPPEKNEINIVYIERTDAVKTTQTSDGTNSLLNDEKTFPGGQKLSEVLKTQIVPNTVENILTNYPAFSYLKGSSIGIGLEYFHGNGTDKENTLAYVGGKFGSSSTPGNDYITYTLGVNLDRVTYTSDGRMDLEATIAHEMIHAFMDEATTSGMIGIIKPDSQDKSIMFPDWFVEGMAQTASGPGNWVKSNSTALRLHNNSTDSDIANAIGSYPLGSNTSASQYGTGYLACMYLGAVIAAGGGAPASPVTAASISTGLNSLLKEVMGGKSLNTAINDLTKGKFTSSGDFQTKFNASSHEIGDFVRGLLTATGSGRGGLVSGDLTATDLTPDNSKTGYELFELDTDHSEVKNVYPEGYDVFTGGTASKPGVPVDTSGTNPNPGPNPPDPNPPDPPNPPKPSDPSNPSDPAHPAYGTGGIILQIGAEYGEILEVPRFYLSLDALEMKYLDISTQDNAWDAIPVIEDAIDRISSIRGTYGAMSNRLEYNQRNLTQTTENLTAAESRIRDADMAMEYMQYVLHTIKTSAAQAMLAQSNQSESLVLQLLR